MCFKLCVRIVCDVLCVVVCVCDLFRVVVCAFGCVFVLRCRCVLFVMYRVLLHELFFFFVCVCVRLCACAFNVCVVRL